MNKLQAEQYLKRLRSQSLPAGSNTFNLGTPQPTKFMSGVSNFIAKNAPNFTSWLRKKFNQPVNLTPKQLNTIQDVGYSATKFTQGLKAIPFVGGPISTAIDPSRQDSWYTKNILSGMAMPSTPATETGKVAGSIAELVPATMLIALGGKSKLFNKGKLANLPIPAQNLLATGGSNALIGAALNKTFGGSALEGAKSGFMNAPAIGLVGHFTNPLIEKLGGSVYNNLSSPVAKQLITRATTGGLNVLEGLPMDLAMGQKTTKESVAIDFLSGMILSTPANAQVKSMFTKAIQDNNVDAFEQAVKVAKKQGIKIDNTKAEKVKQAIQPNKVGGGDLISEARKYKSAEDFPKLQEVVDGAIAKAGERTFEAQKAFNEIIKRTDLSVKELEALSNKVDDLIFHKGYTAEQALQTINQANKVGGDYNFKTNKYYRGTSGKPYIDNNGNLVIKSMYDDMFGRTMKEGNGTSITDDGYQALEYAERGHGDIVEIDKDYFDIITKNYKKLAGQEASRIDEYKGETRIIFNGEIKIPKDKYKVIPVTSKYETEVSKQINNLDNQALIKDYVDYETKSEINESGEYGYSYSAKDEATYNVLSKELENRISKGLITLKDLEDNIKYNPVVSPKWIYDNFGGKKTIKIKSPETKIAELEQKLKNEPDWGKKGKLRAEIEKLRAEIDPTIKARQEEFDKSMELNKQRNVDTAKIQKKLTPVNNRLIELNKEVPQALAKSKGSKKGDDSWVKANELVKEKEKLIQEQKDLLSKRDNVKVKQQAVGETKVEPVEQPKPVLPVGEIKLPKNEIIESVAKTTEPINREVNTKIQPLLEDIQKIMKDKGLVEKDVVNLRRTGSLADKQLTEAFDKLAEELRGMWKKYTGIDIPFRKSYIPDPASGALDKIRALVTGGNFMDDIYKVYSPTMRRLSPDDAPHKTGDLIEAYRSNIDSLKYQVNKNQIDALLNGLSLKSQETLSRVAKEMGEQIRDKGIANADVLKAFREVAENENIQGPSISVPKLSDAKQKVYDIYNGFDRLGIREPLMKFINYEQNGRALASNIGNLVKSGDVDGVVNSIYNRYPTFDAATAKDLLSSIKQRTGSIEEPVAHMIDSLAKREGISTLIDVLPRLKFEDTNTEKYVNDSIAFILGNNAKTKNVFTLFQAKLRKWTTRGLLGLNPSPAIQNLTEIRRLFGTSDPKYILEGISKTSKQLTGGETSALKRYGFDNDGRYTEKFLSSKEGNSLAKGLSGKTDDVLNNVMILFKGSERLKDNVYLNAFEAEGIGKGLKGQDLTDYVSHKFRKYSIHGDEWGTLGMFNKGLFGLKGETVKTILQFNQYSIRELGILMDKFTDIKGEPLQALQYITSYALTGLVLYQAYEAMGLNGKNAAISLPLGLSNTLDRDKNDFYKKTPVDEILQAFRNISPNTSLVTDLGMFAYEYFANNDEGEDRVAPYLEQRVVKDLFGRFPAGGQIMKTYGVPFMGNQYGGYLQNLKAGYQPNTTGNMRFPVTSKTPWEVIKGTTFGPASTKYGKGFWKDYKEGMAPATKDFQLDKYKSLVAQGKREEAVKYWKETYENKKRYFTSKNEQYDKLDTKQKAAFDSIPESNPDTPLDDITKYTLYLQYPEIYNAKKAIAYDTVEGDKSLVDPFYTVDYDTARNYMLYKSQPPKSEESKRIKESHPEVIALAAARSQFYKDHPIEGQEDTGYDAPIASDYVQRQMDLKNWKDPQVKTFLSSYSDWQNDQREAMGLDRIEYGGSGGYDPMKYFHPKIKTLKMKKLKIKKLPKIKKAKRKKYKKLKTKKITIKPIRAIKIKKPKSIGKIKVRS